MIIINENNDVYSFGNNCEGQLGLGYNKHMFVPTKVLSVSYSGFISTFVTVDNELYVFGDNYNKQLSQIEKISINSPMLIQGYRVSSVSCGEYHIAFITTNNDLFTFGANFCQQLGDTISKKTIRHLRGFKVLSASCGDHHIVFITTDNDLYVSGYNHHGQLGLLGIKNVRTPTVVLGSKVSSVTCKSKYTVFTILDNNVYISGNNGHKFDIPTIIPNFKHHNPDNIRFKKTKSTRN